MIPPFNTEYILMSTKSFYLTHNLKSMFVSPALTRIKYLFVFSAKIHPKCTTKAMMIRWWWREEGKNRAMNLEDWTRENFLSRIKYNWGCFSSVLQLLYSAFVKDHHLSYFIFISYYYPVCNRVHISSHLYSNDHNTAWMSSIQPEI